MTEHLTTALLVKIAERITGSEFAVRDLGLLEAAAARPATAFAGHEAYPTLLEKAAALLHSIVSSHPLLDGNKRLGWVAAATFLQITGGAVRDDRQDEAYELVIDVATGSVSDVGQIAKRLVGLVAE
jgi:death-on-curing protein